MVAADFEGIAINQRGEHKYDVPVPEDDDQVWRTVDVIYNNNTITINESLLDTGAAYNEISSDVANELGLYNSNDLEDGGDVETSLGVTTMYRATVRLRALVKNLMKNDVSAGRFGNQVITATVQVVFPKDRNQEEFVPLIIGRTELSVWD